MATKEKIMLVALKLFLKNGLHNVTVNKIITEVGFTQAAFYYHFDSKQQLVETVMNTYFFDYMSLTIEKVRHYTSDWEGFIKILFRFYQIELDFLLEQIAPDVVNEQEMQMLIRDYLFINNETNAYYARNNSRKLPLLIESLEMGIKKGEIKAELDVKKTAHFIICVQEGIKIAYENFDADFKEGLIENNTKMIIDMLKA